VKWSGHLGYLFRRRSAGLSSLGNEPWEILVKIFDTKIFSYLSIQGQQENIFQQIDTCLKWYRPQNKKADHLDSAFCRFNRI
jgi:hypothetical protein